MLSTKQRAALAGLYARGLLQPTKERHPSTNNQNPRRIKAKKAKAKMAKASRKKNRR